MTFSLSISLVSGEPLVIPVSVGETIFVLGANGTGKSSLLQGFATTTYGRSRRITASRQTWFQSSSLEFSPSQKTAYEQQARSWDVNQQSRYMEQNAQIRSGLTIYDLIDAENVDARAIAGAMRAGNVAGAQTLAAKVAPIAKINELLATSNIPVAISVEGGDKLVASKNGGPPYGVQELSDGERNALLIAADVLTAKSGMLLIIDEPERHLHRSIISPLLTALFRFRSDCAFVVATHDLMLPVDNPDSRVLLVRSCSYSAQTPVGWDVDLLPSNADVDEGLKQDIIGARRRIVFVEGEPSSLDQPLYGILFPEVSVVPKGSSRDVDHAVAGITASQTFHWIKAWGIIDNDGREQSEVAALQAARIFALPFYSVESVYYHPDLVRGVAARQSSVIGGDAETRARAAIHAALAATQLHLSRLAARAVEKSVRRQFFSRLPTLRELEQRQPISVQIDTGSIVDAEEALLTAAINREDWTYVVNRCPIRETPALNVIAKEVGLQGRAQYESAVLQMLRDDAAMLATARSFFGSLARDLGIT